MRLRSVRLLCKIAKVKLKFFLGAASCDASKLDYPWDFGTIALLMDTVSLAISVSDAGEASLP